MTFAKSRVGKSMTRAGAFMKRELWIWPIIAVLLLSILGLFVRSAIRRTMEANISSVLNTLLNVEVGMLDTWFDVQLATAEAAANNQNVRRHVYQLLAEREGVADDAAEPVNAEDLRRQLARELGPVITSHDYVGFIIADKSQTIIASSAPDLLGLEEPPDFRSWLTMALDGQSTLSPPFPSVRHQRRSGSHAYRAADDVRGCSDTG